MLTPFHVAVPVDDLEAARKFYVDVLGCGEGRSSNQWIDFDLYGHQFVVHFKESNSTPDLANPVDGHKVPVPHYGVVLTMEAWQNLADKLRNLKVDFIIEPYTRFKGETGEQATLFIRDPAGNALEFKAFANMDQIFAK